MKGILTVYIFFLFAFLSSRHGYAQEDKILYDQGIKNAKAGNFDFAFMNFNSLLETFPQSKYEENALFAVGEYYIINSNYRNAKEAFSRFVNDFPQAKAKLFAFAHLLDIAMREKNEKQSEKIKKQIATSQQLSLLFSEYKVFKYSSPLSKRYKVIYYIDKIEFYLDDKLLKQISY
ncbi:MAG: outer membrane protein assembly factor BamD [Candidatus Omnitrophota bacterium]